LMKADLVRKFKTWAMCYL